MSNAVDRLIISVENLSVNKAWLVFHTKKRIVFDLVYCHSLFLKSNVE